MNLITCFDWTGADYGVEYAPTNDPRIVAIIKRDKHSELSELYDGDAINPILHVEQWYGSLSISHVGGYEGDEAAVMSRAFEQFDRKTARRYLWIFHGIAAEDTREGYIVVTSREFREHVGITEEPATYDEAREDCRAIADDLTNALDGYVYAIGYAINPGRVLDDEPIDLDDGDWDIRPEVWGFVGTEYAKLEAASFGYEKPDLPELLDFAA